MQVCGKLNIRCESVLAQTRRCVDQPAVAWVSQRTRISIGTALLTEAPMRRLHRALEPQLSLGSLVKECSPDVIFVWKTPGSDLTRLVTYPGARAP